MRSVFFTRVLSMFLVAFPILYGSRVLAAKPMLSSVEQDLRTTIQEDGEALKDGIQFVVGNAIWQPGSRYSKGNDWLALTCGAQGCVLEPASLVVVAESWQGHYDDEATPGQKLIFTKTTSSAGGVVAWLQTTKSPSWLVAGAVPTYYSTAIPLKQPQTNGTLETLVPLPSGESSILVPMLLRAKSGSGNPSRFVLQLRSGNRRQFLAGQLGSCWGEVNTSYLLWAGDLDRDGKPDYLVSFVDADGPIHLYLSGRAKKGYLVGLGGKYDAPPFGGECDTTGWLE